MIPNTQVLAKGVQASWVHFLAMMLLLIVIYIKGVIMLILTLTVLVTAIDALEHF